MVRKYVISVCLFKLIKTIRHRSNIGADNCMKRRFIPDAGIVLKACIAISNIAFNAIIRYFAYPFLIFVHSRETFVLVLRTFAPPSNVYRYASE